MSGFGMGIGAFMDGLTKGMKVRREMDNDEADRAYMDRRMKLLESSDARAADQQTFERGMSERRMKLAEGTDARAAASHDLGMRKAQADMEFEQRERAADAPVREAKRKSVLTGLQDDEELRKTQRDGAAEADRVYKEKKAKSIVTSKDDAGNETISVDGQKVGSQDEADKLFEEKHGTFMDAYRTTVVPKVQQGMLARGDVKGADAWRKWNDDERVRKGIDTAGRLETAFRAGDWDRVNRHFNELARDRDYIPLEGQEISAEPIKSDGKTVGLKATYKNRATGETRIEEFKDMEALHTGLMSMVNPATMFEHTRQQVEAVNAAKIKMAEEDRKQANTIEQERVKSALRIGEERARQGYGEPKEYAKGVLDTWNQLNESGPFTKKDANGKLTKMTHEEQMEVAERTYRAIRARAGQPGATLAPATAVAPQRVLMSRQQDAPADAPAPSAASRAAEVIGQGARSVIDAYQRGVAQRAQETRMAAPGGPNIARQVEFAPQPPAAPEKPMTEEEIRQELAERKRAARNANFLRR